MQLWYYPSPTWSIKFAQYGPLASASPPSPSPSPRNRSVHILLAKLTHTLHGLAYFITTYLFPALPPWLNARSFWLLARSLPKTPNAAGIEAWIVATIVSSDCLFRDDGVDVES